ncbi:class I SAM-dependent methyltransferase [Streptomyces jeddahensis]|uniref:Trans-aconitate 2-methyltransferase n=1 Tax=Streptomyces jeddahensis TaxID=1716141 RepID=A0A177HQK4_9ACTN|nr:class I SAM-dependent methyltransferase [Streptomyces jeddahensis]OAH12717.1 trans-aconitate 2-methyltransferase [Streptomyces jeddahensis]
MTETSHLHSTRTSYDTVAVDYARLLGPGVMEGPLDRAMLAAFAELVGADGAGPVADLGCGPGRVTAHLASLGLDAFGVDLSPGMVEVARRTYPGLRFDEGSMTALDLQDESVGGIVAWYSTVHTPPEELPLVFAEFHRVLAPGGHLLLAFKVGDERVCLEHAYGHAVSLDVYRLPPDHIAGLLGRHGLGEVARLVREANDQEKTPQAFLLARKAPQL